jgi:hypothetical protein
MEMELTAAALTASQVAHVEASKVHSIILLECRVPGGVRQGMPRTTYPAAIFPFMIVLFINFTNQGQAVFLYVLLRINFVETSVTGAMKLMF